MQPVEKQREKVKQVKLVIQLDQLELMERTAASGANVEGVFDKAEIEYGEGRATGAAGVEPDSDCETAAIATEADCGKGRAAGVSANSVCGACGVGADSNYGEGGATGAVGIAADSDCEEAGSNGAVGIAADSDCREGGGAVCRESILNKY
jgi:hypothetical protein